MGVHAKRSPSGVDKWGNCPRSLTEEEKYPNESNGASIDGTHTHTVLAYCIDESLPASACVGATFEDDDGEFTCDAERASRVQIALDYINSRNPFGAYVVKSEQQVDPAILTGFTDMKGTIDVEITGFGYLEIIDLKDGMSPVEPKGGQLELYAIGVLARMKAAGETLNPDAEVYLTIVQPRLAVKKMPVVSSAAVTVGYLLERAEYYRRRALLTQDPNADHVPGDKQCKYCRARGACPALASKALGELGMFVPVEVNPAPATPIVTGPVVDPIADLEVQAASQDPATMDNDRIRKVLEATPLVRQLLEGVEKEALARLKAGQKIEGLKLVNGRGSRAWAYDDEEIAKKLVGMGIPKSAVYETKVITPPKIDKLTWIKKDGSKCSLTPRQRERVENEFVTKMSGKPTVALASDSRNEIVTDASEMFKSVGEKAADLPAWLG